MHPAGRNIGVTFIDEPSQLPQLGILLLQKPNASAHNLISGSVGALGELPLDDGIGLGARAVDLAHGNSVARFATAQT